MMIKETAAILLYDKEGRILMIQRTLDAKKNPGCWSFFGGGIEKGETPEKAVMREADEELGITLKNPALLLTSEHEYADYTDRMHIFTQKFAKNMKLKQKEGRAKAWYKPSDALKLNLSPDIRTALEKMAKIWPIKKE
jgi:8-oxo-dGTP diphosphatase